MTDFGPQLQRLREQIEELEAVVAESQAHTDLAPTDEPPPHDPPADDPPPAA